MLNPYNEDAIPIQRYYGKYKGFVRRNDDPENRGRLRCYCPQVMGGEDSQETWLGWAEPAFPWLGGINTGDFGPPYTRDEQIEETGSEYFGVWLEFEAGNPDFPIWTGTFTVAPTPDDKNAHNMPVPGGGGQVGGGIIGSSLPSGSEDGPLNPPQAERTQEIRLRARQGRDIVIGVEGGGYIIMGPSGVHAVGIQITVNGRSLQSSSTTLTGK